MLCNIEKSHAIWKNKLQNSKYKVKFVTRLQWLARLVKFSICLLLIYFQRFRDCHTTWIFKRNTDMCVFGATRASHTHNRSNLFRFVLSPYMNQFQTKEPFQDTALIHDHKHVGAIKISCKCPRYLNNKKWRKLKYETPICWTKMLIWWAFASPASTVLFSDKLNQQLKF